MSTNEPQIPVQPEPGAPVPQSAEQQQLQQQQQPYIPSAQQPQFTQAPQPVEHQQQFAQPQQQQPQYPQQPAPQVPQQATQPWQTDPASAYSPGLQAPGYGATPASGRTNVFGIIALALLVLDILVGPIQTFLITGAIRTSGDTSSVMVAVMIITSVILLAALLFAILGVRQRNATRFRWAAIGALVASSLSIVSTLIAYLSNAIMASIY